MKFIRAYWGDLDYRDGLHRTEMKQTSINEKLQRYDKLDMVVYVWGDENEEYIKSLGYDTIKMSSKPTEFADDIVDGGAKFFVHKYAAMRAAIEDYGACVFLDWDAYQVKSLDSEFYKSLDLDILVPLYSYPSNYLEDVLSVWTSASDRDREFLRRYNDGMFKYSYRLDDDIILPCSCYMYCSSVKVIDEFLRILYGNEGIFSDEFVWYIYASQYCNNLDDYIKKFEPSACDAKLDDHYNQINLKKYISGLKTKNLYFQHR